MAAMRRVLLALFIAIASFCMTEALTRGAHHHLRAPAKKGAAHRPGRHTLTPSHRGSNDVTKVVMNAWSEERKENFMKALPEGDDSRWWARLGNTVFGPGALEAMHTSGDHSLEEEDSNDARSFSQGKPSDYMWFLGDGRGVPESLRPLVVGGIEDAATYIIRAPQHGEGDKIEDFDEDAHPLVNGATMMVPVPPPSAAESRELEEEDFPIDIDVSSVTSQSYEKHLRAFLRSSVSDKALSTARKAHQLEEEESDDEDEILALGQRYVGTEGHDMAQNFLVNDLESVGGVRIAKQKYHSDGRGTGFQGTNVIGCIAGASPDFITIGGHTDTLPSSSSDGSNSPGAMDDASGTVAAQMTFHLIASARDKLEAQGKKLPCTVCATYHDGEEHGLTGSDVVASTIRENIDRHAKGSRRGLEEVGGATSAAEHALGRNIMNIVSDMSTGFKPSAGDEDTGVFGFAFEEERDAGWRHGSKNVKARTDPSTNEEGVHIDGNGQNLDVFNAFVDAGKRPEVEGQVYESDQAIWNSDHKSFFRHNLPAVDICAANHRKYKYWHDQHDTIDQLEFNTGAQVVKTMYLGIANIMSRTKFSKPPSNGHVYTLADHVNRLQTSTNSGDNSFEEEDDDVKAGPSEEDDTASLDGDSAEEEEAEAAVGSGTPSGDAAAYTKEKHGDKDGESGPSSSFAYSRGSSDTSRAQSGSGDPKDDADNDEPDLIVANANERPNAAKKGDASVEGEGEEQSATVEGEGEEQSATVEGEGEEQSATALKENDKKDGDNDAGLDPEVPVTEYFFDEDGMVEDGTDNQVVSAYGGDDVGVQDQGQSNDKKNIDENNAERGSSGYSYDTLSSYSKDDDEQVNSDSTETTSPDTTDEQNNVDNQGDEEGQDGEEDEST